MAHCLNVVAIMQAHDGGDSIPLWSEAVDDLAPDLGDPPRDAEVAIIGAGIAGLTTALELARQGAHVVVLDDGPIGGGETGRTSAHLTSVIDDGFARIERVRGKRIAAIAAESHMAAIDEIEANVRELAIDCAFQRVDGYLFAPPGQRGARSLDREYDAARRAGMLVDRVVRAPLPFDTGPALRFGRQAEFHPLLYLHGIARAVIALGGTIAAGRAISIEPGDPVALRLADGRVMPCKLIVDATNGAFTSPIRLAIRHAAYRSYVIAFDIAHRTIPRALYWDTADPYHYVRLADSPDGRELLIVGGSDHRTGQGDPERAFRDLEQWARRWFPMAHTVVAQWSGQILEPPDGLASIGKSPSHDHVYVVTGDSGEGLTHGTIAGLLLPELMRGHQPRWAEAYDPSRHRVRTLGTLIGEALKSTLPYSDWVRGGDLASADDIGYGEGAVIRRGLHLVACYRDELGTCHERSATCPHMHGVVRWNAAEKTWDCPCHGSRFDRAGRVINGPAVSDLTALEPVPPRLPDAVEATPGRAAYAPPAEITDAIRAAVIDHRGIDRNLKR